MFKRLLAVAALSAAVAGFGAAAPAQAADSYKFAVTDVKGLEGLQRDWGGFRDALQKATGLEFEFFPVTNRTAAAEALAAKRVDFVLTGPAEYVVMNKMTGAKPVVGFGRPDYFSGIIVLAKSGISSVQDLKGKKVALGDVGSTSSHLAPSQLLADYGLDPTKDVELIYTSEPIQWEALKRGDVAAVGMNYMSDFVSLRDDETELPPGAFRVIARGPDLPNDILMVASHVDQKVVDKMRKAFEDQNEALVKAVVSAGGENEKYTGMSFIPNVQDSDYDYVRNAYKAIGHPQYAEFVGD